MAEEEKEQGKDFRIVDRRRFSEEGEIRAEAEEIDTSSDEDAKTDASAGPEQQQETLADAAEEGHGSPPKVDFPSFIVSMATQALMMMGEIPDPESKLTSMNLSAAKQTIDIIAVLEEKTKGNLTEEEEKLLTEILASLRLAFVNKINKP